MPVHRTQVGPMGALIQVGLSVGTARASAGLGGAPRSYTGLIDTGASVTAISTAARLAVDPQRIGRRPVSRPGGAPVLRSEFAVRLKFEGHLSPHPWFDLEVVLTDPAAPGVDVLIGMDVLSQLVLVCDGPRGHLLLTY